MLPGMFNRGIVPTHHRAARAVGKGTRARGDDYFRAFFFGAEAFFLGEACFLAGFALLWLAEDFAELFLPPKADSQPTEYF